MPRKKLNPRVGVKSAPYVMATSFRSVSPKQVERVQLMYRKRWYSQAQLADIYGVSVATIGKIVRCDPYWQRGGAR